MSCHNIRYLVLDDNVKKAYQYELLQIEILRSKWNSASFKGEVTLLIMS